MANGRRLGGCDQAPGAFIQNAGQNVELARQGFGGWHQCQYRTFHLINVLFIL
jgi:hypothetical protein